jgi:hypothetical protein
LIVQQENWRTCVYVKDGSREITEGVKIDSDGNRNEGKEEGRKSLRCKNCIERKNKTLYGFILEIYCSLTGGGLCFGPVLTLIRRRL